MALTDREVDRILSVRIPGGSEARHWFLPHDTKKGLENVRNVVRAMIEVSDPNRKHWAALAEACTKFVGGESEAEKIREAIDRLCAAIMDDRPPVDILLYCPVCGGQHVDAQKLCSVHDCHLYGKCYAEANGDPEQCDRWDNPPHKSHLCHFCGHIWRPADAPTNGVAEIKTAGKNDSPKLSRFVLHGQGTPTEVPVRKNPEVPSRRLLKLLQKVREREHNPFEPGNQSAFYHELSDAIVSALVLDGGLGPVRSTDGELPPEETPVLVRVNGVWRIGERRWEHPGHEDTFGAYWYWDDPNNDGQEWDRRDVTAWAYLPDGEPVVDPDPIKTQAVEELFQLGYTFRDGLLCPFEKGITK
jgi:hypothetical protein